MIDELARAADPTPLHAELRARGAHRLADGRWVVAMAADVTAVLGSPHAAIGFPPDPARPATALQARMARFTDGPAHRERRAAVERLLAGIDPGQLRRAAATLSTAGLTGRQEVEVMAALARPVPVAALAAALGADPVATVPAVAELARALAPPLGTSPPAADAALATLTGQLAHRTEAGADVPVAAISLLFQALDATAGLIGNAAARLGDPAPGPDDSAARVAHVLRTDCPVQLTTRLATAPLELGDRVVPEGDRVVVVLAAAETPAGHPPFGFGRGRHACPGAAHAVALAAGVLDALTAAGVRPHPGPLTHEPRLNLRIPTTLPSRTTLL